MFRAGCLDVLAYTVPPILGSMVLSHPVLRGGTAVALTRSSESTFSYGDSDNSRCYVDTPADDKPLC